MRCVHCNNEVEDDCQICPICGQDPHDADNESLKEGTLLKGERYIIRKKLGSGGFGKTYKAKDTQENRIVVIKELFLSRACRRLSGTKITFSSSRDQAQFNKHKKKAIEEFKYLKNINHPNIVKVYDQFEENNTIYTVMQYLDGKTLKQYIQTKGKLTEKETIYIFKKLLTALNTLHSNNLLHRDIKPENIILEDNEPILIDFGTIKEFTRETIELTGTHTPGYAPIEATWERYSIGPEYDIYSLGITVYSMLSGDVNNITPPSQREKDVDNIANFINKANINKKLKRIILKCIEIDPKDRPKSAKEVLDELNKLEEKETKEEEKTKETREEKSTIDRDDNNKKGLSNILSGALKIGIIVIIAFLALKFWNKEKNYINPSPPIASDKSISSKNKAKTSDSGYAVDSETYFKRGVNYLEQGKYEQAIGNFNKAIELNPKYANAYYNRGVAYYSKGEYDKAIADYTKAIELNPKFAKAYNDRGIAYKNKGEYDKAIADYTKAIELNPKFAEAYYNRGWVYYKKGDIEKACADEKHACDLGKCELLHDLQSKGYCK